MKKNKAKEVDSLLIQNKQKKSHKKGKERKKQSKKNVINEENDDVFQFDEEIVIGVTKKEEKTSKNNKKRKKEDEENKNSINDESQSNLQNPKKKGKIFKFFRFLAPTVLVVGAALFFLLSPTFNIKQIVVKNNNHLTTEEIISLSGIEKGENLFKLRTGQAENNVKENAYIEAVKVNRIIPDTIEIEVTERVPTFMIEIGNAVALINNQGFILEITQNRIQKPIIMGYQTSPENIKTGERLCKEDLYKMETVLKIVETANSYEIGNLITKIEIADKNDFILYLESETKTVYLGNASNINTRIMYLKEIITKEKGINSEIFINGDINKDDVYTREKLSE